MNTQKIRFGSLPTEKANPRSRAIDRCSVPDILNLINKEDETVPRAVRKVRSETARAVALIVSALKNSGKLYFAGAGTSGRLGVIEAAECPPTFGTPPSLVQAVMAGGKSSVFRSKEGAEDRSEEALRIFLKKLTKRDVLVGIAASGVTPFVRGALEAARRKGAKRILISCNAASPLRALTDCLISPRVGPEIIAGSTRLKAGTATKLVLNMLTVASMIKLGKVYENWMVDLKPKSKKLRARAVRLIGHLGRVSEKEAEKYFRQSGKRVKPAILMARRRCSLKEASRRLKRSSGFLGAALIA